MAALALAVAVTGAPHGLALSWLGWRVPFLLGLLVGLVGVALRRELPVQAEPAGPANWTALLRPYAPVMLTLVVGNWAFTTGYYMIFLYLSTYLSTETGLPAAEALRLNTLSLLALALIIPLGGRLADRFSGRGVACAGFLALAILAVPLFMAMDRGGVVTDWTCQTAFVVVFALLEGSLPGVMAGAFPRPVRARAVAISYNSATALFGGTTPWLATALIARTGDRLAPSYYLALVALISAGAIALLPRSFDAEM